VAFEEAGFGQPLAKTGDKGGVSARRLTVEKTDHRHCRLLRARSERPRRRATDQHDERAAVH